MSYCTSTVLYINSREMRTSKISRDTARMVTALSSSSSSSNGYPTRRSLRQFTNNPAPVSNKSASAAAEDSTVNGDGSLDASSELSSPPPSSPLSGVDSDSGSGSDYAGSPSPTASSRKRKRRADGATAPFKRETAIKKDTEKTKPAAAAAAAAAPKKPRRQPAKHIKAEHGTTAASPPENWEQVYNLTAEMRKTMVAPVDTMGCDSLADEAASPRDQRLQTLVALMLSSQTKDTVTAAAMRNLQQQLSPSGFNLAALLAVAPERLDELIGKVGFHNTKTRYIKATAERLRDEFGGDIPDTLAGLTSLPGVGPKMAFLTLSAAWGRDEGIGVDVHVHRITNLWGWHRTASPEQTRLALQAWLPRDKWHDINRLLVGFGQVLCLPVGRKCGECVLADRRLCPSAVVKKTEVRKKVKKEKRDPVGQGQGVGGLVKEEEEEQLEEDVVIKQEDKADDAAPGLDVPLPGAHLVPDIEDMGRGARGRKGFEKRR